MSLFRTRSSQRPFTGGLVSVRVDQVEMPDGTTARREVVEHPLAVAVVALDDADRVVLVEQYRHPLGRRLWEVPAGLMDVAGEPPLATARRELVEETGLAAADWAVVVDFASSPGFTTEAIRVYLARSLTEVGRGVVSAGDEETDLRIVRAPLTEVVDAIYAGDVVNPSTVAGVLAVALARAGGHRLRPADQPWSGPSREADPRPDLTRDHRW